jgi:histidinol-phosphate/aromatic aminotransferase/cobyric acid decarboxylase-like protein
MNFTTFQEQRQALLAARPELLDCAETNLYRALSHLIPATPPPVTGTVHRCHLASQWVATYDLPAEWSKRAFISNGVRDSLTRLFSHYAQQGTQLWIPEDNYPVYHELATAAGLSPKTFPTLPDIQWPTEAPSLQDEVLLITHPLKPRNRPLESDDADSILAWLQVNPRRRLLLDAVYTLEARFDKTTRRLLETEQTILLHSLTKGWLYPRLFGIALVPEADAEDLKPAFRDSPPSQSHLNTARNLMTAHPDTPRRVAQALEAAQRHLFSSLPALPQEPLPTHGVGYFFPIQMPWQELLNHHVLGLPATTFGSKREDFTILSSLSFTS